MSTYRISQLADHVGIPATTLRFYEREGLLPAARTSSGYRQYTDHDRERVQFIAAAKHLGLPLDQIRDLLTVWAGGMCRDVRDELRPRVTAQVAAADERITDLQLFRDRLAAALIHLRGLPAKDGPCGPTCSFLHDLPTGHTSAGSTPTEAAAETEVEAETVVACSLDSGAYQERIDAWRGLLADAEIVALPDGGRTARLPTDRAEQATRLVIAEQHCCPFFSFKLDFRGELIELTAHVPDGAEHLVTALFEQEPAAGERLPVLTVRSIALFIVAALFEIGGAWLVWQGVREHRGWVWIGAGVIALGIYGFAATLQPDAEFGRILAAYGGVFVAGSLAWGMVADGYRPDRYDVIGALVCLAGVAVIMYAPRTGATS